MKTIDLDSKITAHQLNENLYKKFGTRINLDQYTREELENYRNLLRTKINQTELTSSYNDLLTNEAYHKDKFVMTVLNTKIKEMLGEGAKQDRQAAHITKSMMKKGKSRKEAEGIAWAHIKHPKKTEEGTKMKKGRDKTGDGKSDFDDVQVARMTAGGVPKEKAIARATSDQYKEGFGDYKRSTDDTSRGGGGVKLGSNYGGGRQKARPEHDDETKHEPTKKPAHQPDKELSQITSTEPGRYGDPHSSALMSQRRTHKVVDKAEKAKRAKTSEAAKVKKDMPGNQERIDVAEPHGKITGADFKKLRKSRVKEYNESFKNHVRVVNESLVILLKEDEEQKAKAITAASDMVNDFTTWMQRVGQYQTKAIVELGDAIRSEFGPEKSEIFKQTVAPALAATLATMTEQREVISGAVAALAGDAADQMPMGTEPGMQDMGPSSPEMMEPDGMNAGDEFAASDAAAGGMETAGREMRESREERRARKLRESHELMRILSK